MIRKVQKANFKYKATLTYDPDDVNVRLQYFRVSDLIRLIDKEMLDILEDENIYTKGVPKLVSLFDEDEDVDIYTEDDLQRMPDLWNDVQKSRFIESLMIKLPIPIFYLDGSTKPWRVIDGLQRLHSIMGFVQGKYKLTSLEYLAKECDGKYFNDESFPGYLKARILDAELIAYVISPGTPEDVKYNIFQRINTGGLKLNGQEIRNAIFRGKPSNLTKKLAAEEVFKMATNGKITSRRMIDREYANRFIAFQVFDYKDYNGKMDLFLSEALLDLYSRNENEFYELNELFKTSMKRAFDLFEGYAFYRPKPNGDWGRQPNKALFDTLSWNLSEMTDRNYNSLLRNRSMFQRAYIKFMNKDEIMFKSINDTTSSKSAVLNRFKKLNNFLNDYTK